MKDALQGRCSSKQGWQVQQVLEPQLPGSQLQICHEAQACPRTRPTSTPLAHTTGAKDKGRPLNFPQACGSSFLPHQLHGQA